MQLREWIPSTFHFQSFTLRVLRRFLNALAPRKAFFGSLGNHHLPELHELLAADAVGAVCAANANVSIFEVLLSLDVLNLCSKGVVGFHVGVLRFALFSLSVCTYSL